MDMDQNVEGLRISKASRKENSDLLMPNPIQKCIEVLERFIGNDALLAELPNDQRVALMAAAGRLSRPARDEIRVRNREIDKSRRRKSVMQDRGTYHRRMYYGHFIPPVKQLHH